MKNTPSPLNSSVRRTLSIPLAAAIVLLGGICQTSLAGPLRFLPVNDEVASRKIGVLEGKGITPLDDLSSRKRSKVYDCNAGEKPLALVALDRQRPNGNPASVEIPSIEGMKSPLVLILEDPDPDSASGMRAVAVEDGIAGFPWGALRFLNVTGKPLMLRHEKDSKRVPEAVEPLDIAPGGESRNMGIQLYSESDPDQVLYSAVWEHDPNLRKLIFIIPSEEAGNDPLMLEVIPQDKRTAE